MNERIEASRVIGLLNIRQEIGQALAIVLKVSEDLYFLQ